MQRYQAELDRYEAKVQRLEEEVDELRGLLDLAIEIIRSNGLSWSPPRRRGAGLFDPPLGSETTPHKPPDVVEGE